MARALSAIHDNDNQTSFKTKGHEAYPWIWVDLQRKYLITKLAIMSGEEPLMNLDVRVGNEYLPAITEKSAYTQNTRCAMYYGPTLLSKQWVELDCGFPRGIKGKHISLQLTDRLEGNNRLEITELEIYGWGRLCSNRDPEK